MPSYLVAWGGQLGGLCEHRLGEQGLEKAKQKLNRIGYKILSSSAGYQTEEGTAGGTLLFARRTIDAVGLPYDVAGTEGRLCFGILRLRGVSILIGMVYFVTGVGNNGENLNLWKELGKKVDECKVPFLFFGDFSMDEEEIMQADWLTKAGAVLHMKAAGIEFTC